MKYFQLISWFLALNVVNSARILGVVPSASLSHQLVFRPIWKELSLRGHEVVVLTTDPVNDKSLKNLTEIDLHFSYDISINKHKFTEKINSLSGKPLQMLDAIITVNADVCNEQLKHPKVRKLIEDKSEYFDVVLIEVLQPCMFAFAHRFKAPFIGIVSMDAQTAIYDSIGNPTHPILYPDFMLPYVGKLSFVERLTSFFYTKLMIIYGYLYIVPLNDKVIRENFGNYPSCVEFINYLDMVFVNAHPLLYGVKPYVPAVVNIGAGIHLQPPKPLPEELSLYLDKSTKGVIYFSLGSNVKSKDINQKTRDVIIETFSELPYDILWKFEADTLHRKPNNVKIMKWLPQQDVLRHPNVKLFITQGGLQSSEEAIFCNVPIVGMPFFADQVGNVKKMVQRGLGVMIDHAELTKETFKSAILDVIENETYQKNVKKLSELIQDEPMTGLERAVWWTEYVIRHKGAKHYRSPAIDAPFYEYLMLDIYGFVLIMLLIVIYIIVKILVSLCKLLKIKSKRD